MVGSRAKKQVTLSRAPNGTSVLDPIAGSERVPDSPHGNLASTGDQREEGTRQGHALVRRADGPRPRGLRSALPFQKRVNRGPVVRLPCGGAFEQDDLRTLVLDDRLAHNNLLPG
jgi:hypothetical protein